MRQVAFDTPKLTCLTYPLPGAPRVPKGDDSDETVEPTAGTLAWPSIQVSYPLSKEIIIDTDSAGVAWWDAELEKWKTDGFSDIKMDGKKKLLEFKTNHFAPTSIIQSRAANYEIKGWKIYSNGEEGARLFLNGKRGEIEILVKGRECKIVRPRYPELAKLRSNFTRTSDFIKACIRSGLDVFPGLKNSPEAPEGNIAIDDDFQVSLYKQMSRLATVFSFVESGWHFQTDSHQIVLRSREGRVADKDGKASEGEFALILCDTADNITHELSVMENDDDFSSELKEGKIIFRTLYQTLYAGASDEAKNELKKTTHHFVDSMFRLLCAIRPLQNCNGSDAKGLQSKAAMVRREEERKAREEEERAREAAEKAALEAEEAEAKEGAQ